MKHWLWVFVVCAGCFSRSAMMTQETFNGIRIGTPIHDIVKVNGEPYAVTEKNGLEEYHYVERMTAGNQLLYETHFILTVQGGVVVSKNMSQEMPPAYDIMYQNDPNHSQYP